MIIGRSAMLFQERRGLRSTMRGPGPRIHLVDNEARQLRLTAPLPLPALLSAVQAANPPAAGKTAPWPHAAQELWICG